MVRIRLLSFSQASVPHKSRHGVLKWSPSSGAFYKTHCKGQKKLRNYSNSGVWFTGQVRIIKMEMIKGERCWQAIQEDSPSLSPLYVNMANIPRENTRVPWEMWYCYRKAPPEVQLSCFHNSYNLCNLYNLYNSYNLYNLYNSGCRSVNEK